MHKLRNTTRRSFLSRVAGGGLIVGAGLVFGAGGGAAQQQKGPPDGTRRMVVDADPRDPARPPPETRPSPPSPPSRPSDTDSGPNSDPTITSHHRVTTSTAPAERFVVCPGNPRCPS